MIRSLNEIELGELKWITQSQSPAFHWDLEQVRALAVSHEFWGLFTEESEVPQLIAVAACMKLPQAWEFPFLATHPDFQRKGIMRKLLGSLIDAKRRDGEIWLEVHEGNQSARALYQSLGFQEVGRRQGYYSDGGTAVLLSLK